MVVGAGQAGGEAAMLLRQYGFQGRLLVLGEEPQHPYMRPPLSKAFLAGEAMVGSLLIRPPTAYEKAAVEIRTNTVVAHVDRHARTVRTTAGETIGYDKLIIATGGRPRKMKVPGSELGNIFYLRTIADVEALQPGFVPGRKLVIIGGGYIGLEVAAVAVKRRLEVTVLEGAPRVLARVTSPEMSVFYERVHRAQGVRIRTGVAVSGFIPSVAGNTVGLVECGENDAVPADLVIIGVGLIPNTELAEGAGLVVENGITVDANGQTSDPHIYAIGDCAGHAHHGFLQRRIRLESVPNATEQARAVAAAICGKPPFSTSPLWFWSEQYNLKLQMVGLSDGYDELVMRGDLDSESFIIFYVKHEEIIAADAVNRAESL
jgi:3-phenylpropionate/trans-cinnamate dioxygenase ferredoxin reductase subunit